LPSRSASPCHTQEELPSVHSADRLEGEAAEHVRNERTEIGYQDYDWALNARAEPEEEPAGADDAEGD